MNLNIYLRRLCIAVALFSFSNISYLHAQCPPADRTIANCKAGTPDAIGAVLKNFFQGEDIDKAAWLFEDGGTFVENGDGTADLTAVLAQYPLPSNRRFLVSIHYTGQTMTAPAGSPMLINLAPFNISTQGWYYYEWGAATLTGLSDLDGAQLNLTKRGKAAQAGIGGADQVADIDKFGMSAWFNWEIVSQPTNTAIVINDFPANPSIDQGDLCMQLSGTPTVCNNPTACIGGLTYCDNNNNGIYDAGDAIATNLTITLCDAGFNTLATQTVDANGKYLFANLAAATYFIKFPTATLDGKPLTTASPVQVVLADAQKVNDINGGYFKPIPPTACIGGLTYCDNNNNGIYDAGDAIATNLTITLCDAGFNTLATQTVDANGKYLFADLAAATYYIKFPTATLDGKPLSTASPVQVVLADAQKVNNINGGYFKPCSAIFDANKCYRIVSALSGKTVDVYGASTANDAAIVQWAWNGGTNQIWQIVPTSNGYVKIVSRNSGKTLACHYSTSGSLVYQYDYYDGGAKEWKIECTTGGYKLTHRLSGKVLDLSGSSTVDGAKLQIKSWAGSNNQIWKLEEVNCPPPPCKPIVTFYNKANCTVNLYLINGTSKTLVKQLSAGQSCSINAADAQIYRACNASTGAQITEYKVNGCAAQSCNIAQVNLTCNLTFYNKTSGQCNIYWINSYGQKVLYKTLSGYQSYSVNTYMSHKWLVCNYWGSTISNYTVSKYGNSWCNIYSNYGTWYLNNVEVLTLDARQNAGRVTLNWTNNTGFKNDFFALQRLNNETGKFEDLKVLNNFQESEDLAVYTEYDDAPQADENIYRVKLSQYDGSVKYTEEKTVKTGKYEAVRMFPNPAIDVLNVDLSNYEGRTVTILLYDQIGKMIQSQIVESASKAPFQMNITDEKAGTYLLRIYSEGKRDVVKQVILAK